MRMETHKYGNANWSGETGSDSMKTTVEIPDELYRRAKATAALRGRRLRDLVEEGLRLVLENSSKTPSERDLAALWKSVSGIVESGIPDLASNPEHLAGFGHGSSGNR
jgi:hypothetical protein